jgi:nucleoside-diphosphate-sugar epimerase
LVAAANMPYTIIRPTLVYDRDGGQELQMFLDYLQRFPVVPFIGAGSAIKRPVLSDDIVTGLVAIVDRADRSLSYGKIYNFSGGEPISMLEFARLLLLHRAEPKVFVPIPVPLCVAGAQLLALVMERPALTLNAIAGVVNDADLDPSEAMRDLGYDPIGVRAGFERCFPRSALAPAHSEAP